jgi:uncharacterized protein
MNAYYLDTSAILKCYINEQGSLWLRALLLARPHHRFYTCRLSKVEFASAVARRVRDGSISP